MKYNFLILILTCFCLHAEQSITNDVLCSFDFTSQTTNIIYSGEDKFVVDGDEWGNTDIGLNLLAGHIELSENTFDRINDVFTLYFQVVMNYRDRRMASYRYGEIVSRQYNTDGHRDSFGADMLNLYSRTYGPSAWYYYVNVSGNLIFYKWSNIDYLQCHVVCDKGSGIQNIYINGKSLVQSMDDARSTPGPARGYSTEETGATLDNFIRFGCPYSIELGGMGSTPFPGTLIKMYMYNGLISDEDIKKMIIPKVSLKMNHRVTGTGRWKTTHVQLQFNNVSYVHYPYLRYKTWYINKYNDWSAPILPDKLPDIDVIGKDFMAEAEYAVRGRPYGPEGRFFQAYVLPFSCISEDEL